MYTLETNKKVKNWARKIEFLLIFSNIFHIFSPVCTVCGSGFEKFMNLGKIKGFGITGSRSESGQKY